MAEITMDERLAHLEPMERAIHGNNGTKISVLVFCPGNYSPFSRFQGFGIVKSGRKEPAPTKVGHRTLGCEASIGKA
jgi:hypothetical protein